MVAIHIDGERYEVEEGQNLLQACQTLGLELPYFCWHPAMGSVGSCRQCAVILYQNEDDTRGRLTMSCMTPVSEGQRLSLEHPKAKEFRSQLIEATMTNHPHDCPVCEEGGECHLQDMTLLSGHTERRYRGPKRTHLNQHLGPFINHEMNRCIGCYRCIRFYRDYAGGTDLNVFASRNNIYFGRAEDGELENAFSGNLVEVCPTGVFTDKTFSQHYCRKWELQSAPSICTLCSVGCNIQPGERDGTLRRITNRYNPDINGYFLCDRGRFGYGYVNHPQRTAHPWQRNNSQHRTDRLNHEQASVTLRELMATSRSQSGNQSVIAVGSSRSSLENNFALRELAGHSNFFSDCHQSEHALLKQLIHHYQNHPPVNASLKYLETADTSLLIGEDITQTAPRIALSLRQMSKNAGIDKASKMGVQYWSAAEVKNITQELKSPLHIVSSHGTTLDDIAESTARENEAGQVELIWQIIALLEHNNSLANQAGEQAKVIADDLRRAQRPVIVTGINSGSEAVLQATLALRSALHRIKPNSGFICALPQANSLGLSLLSKPDNHLSAVFDKLEQTPPQTLVILETDLYRFCEAHRLEALLDKVENIIVLDHLLTPTGEQADLLLPTTSFAEYHGSWVNYEGRLQAAVSCFPPNDERFPAHHWLSNDTDFHTLVSDLGGVLDCFAGLPSLYPKKPDGFRVARKTMRASGRTASNAAIDVREHPPAPDKDSPYQYSQEGVPNSVIIAKSGSTAPAQIWSPGWNSTESLSHFQNQANGAIVGNHPGIMLFTQPGQNSVESTEAEYQPDLCSIPEGGIRLGPYHQIFGDDELSSYVECIQQRATRPTIKVNNKQAQKMGVEQGDAILIAYEGAIANAEQPILPLTIDNNVADDIALIPAPLFQITRQNKARRAWAYLEKYHE